MYDAHQCVVTHGSAIASLVHTEYNQKWACEDRVRTAAFAQHTSSTEGGSLALSTDSWETAVEAIKNEIKIDSAGISASSLLIAFRANPRAVTDFLNCLSCNVEWIRSQSVLCRVSAKKAGTITPAQTRVIMPLPVLLATIEIAFYHFLKEWLAAQPPPLVLGGMCCTRETMP